MGGAAQIPPAISRLVFAVVLLSCAYFVQGAGPNQNSRYDLVRALVEDGTVRIDRFHTNTHDIARHEGHWYSDKAPGLALAAAVPYALGARLTQPRAEVAPRPWSLHLVTVATCALATALAAVAMLHLLVGLGLGLPPALLATFGWTFGTSAFAYATLFLGHQFVAALLVLALAAIQAARARARIAAGRPARPLVLAGLAAGLAVIGEYPVAVIVLLLAAYVLATLGARGACWLAAGGVAPALMLLGYNLACFGRPLQLGYESLAVQEFARGLDAGFLGFSAPRLGVIAELTIFEFRGLLPLSPFLVLALPGAWWMLRDRERRPLGALCVIAFVAMLVLMSGFRFWTGGAALGPRHLVPALPFAILPAAVAIDRLLRWRPRAGLALAGALLAVSIAVCTICVAVGPEFYEDFNAPPGPGVAVPDPAHPITSFALPMFWHGHLSQKPTWGRWWAPSHEDAAYNLGEALGLSGKASLLPLAIGWLGVGIALVRLRARDRP